jgi:uncharacterized OsmC-like protein
MQLFQRNFSPRLSYRGGVTTAVTAPLGNFLLGLSTAFAVGANNALEKNAIIQDEVALHVTISRQSTRRPSVSTQIAALRRILFDGHFFDVTIDFNQNTLDRVRKVTESARSWRLRTICSLSCRVISRSSSMLTVST